MEELRLTVPEPSIEIYRDGFEGICKLGRAEQGKKLSDLVERISQPMVIAVDAPWGAGKSVFLKCWVGAHENENQGTAKTVYFDAFQHDYLDEPLIGLMTAITERFEDDDKKSDVWKKAKTAAFKLMRPSLRIALAAATAGVTEAVGPMLDAGAEATEKELGAAVNKFWKKEEGRLQAMQDFRETLKALVKDQKLVIVVDELDRCRPDYALNFLEVIKHFFDVPNVHFVLGVNLKEMSNVVRARYGGKVSAERYLQKFVTVSMPLERRQARSGSDLLPLKHFEAVSGKLGITGDRNYNALYHYLPLVNYNVELSLRDVERILTLSLVATLPHTKKKADFHLYAGLLILKVIEPNIFERARNGTLLYDDVLKVFDFESAKNKQNTHDEQVVWSLVTARRAKGAVALGPIEKNLFGSEDYELALRRVIAECFGTFEVLL